MKKDSSQEASLKVDFGAEYSIAEITSREQFIGKEHAYEFAMKNIGRFALKTVIEAFGAIVLPGTKEQREQGIAASTDELGLIVVTREKAGAGAWDYERKEGYDITTRANLMVQAGSFVDFMDAYPPDDPRLRASFANFNSNKEAAMRHFASQLKKQIDTKNQVGS